MSSEHGSTPAAAPSTASPQSVVAAMFATPLARGLVAAIVLMTVAMVFMGGMIVGALVGPGRPAGSGEALASGDLPEMAIGLPLGAEVVRAAISGERLMVVYVAADGEQEALVLAAPTRPTRLVYRFGSDVGAGAGEE